MEIYDEKEYQCMKCYVNNRQQECLLSVKVRCCARKQYLSSLIRVLHLPQAG